MEYLEMRQIPHMIDMEKLPKHFPTHRHDPLFWEHLGRTIATYGFLEEILGRAIFALTGTQPCEEGEYENRYPKFLSTLENALTDSLANLINSYEKALSQHPGTTSENHEELLTQLREGAKIRNVLCHASWNKKPDEYGMTLPRPRKLVLILFSGCLPTLPAIK